MFDVFDQVPPDGISPQELEELQEHIAVIQEQGLNLAEQYLTQWTSTGDKSYEKAPTHTDEVLDYDFAINDETGRCYLCAKSTEGGFNNPIHISYNELLQMRDAASYDLYRIYDVTEMRASLRIARGMKHFAETVLAVLEQLPDGIRSDSISVSPDVLNFESPVTLEMSNDPID